MMNKIKVEGHNNLYRDASTGAIINSNIEEYKVFYDKIQTQKFEIPSDAFWYDMNKNEFCKPITKLQTNNFKLFSENIEIRLFNSNNSNIYNE